MRHATAIVAILVLVLAGCQDQHQKNKDAAFNRWNVARSQISLNLAYEQYQSGDLTKSSQTVQAVIQNNPDYVPAHLLLGRIYLEQELFAKAKKCFDQCLALEPDYSQANYYLGVVHEKWNELDKASEYYEQAWRGQPEHVPYLLAAVETRISQGQYQESLDLLLKGMEETERDPRLYMTAGAIYSHQERYPQAIEMYQKARAGATDDSSVTEALAFCLHKVGRDKEALRLFQNLIDSAKKQAKAPAWSHYLAMGDCYMNLQQYHEARRCFEEVGKHDGSNPKIWIRLAQAVMARQDYEQASVYVKKALALNPNDTDALIAQGYLAMEKSDNDQAQSIFSKVTKINDQHTLAYCLLGQTYEAKGNRQEAATCYAKALQIDPQDKLAQKLMISIQEKAQSKSTGVETF